MPIQGLSLELFAITAHNPPLSWDTVLSFCKQSNPTLRPEQILVVTSDLYRICESASQAGLPTAFLKVPDSRSANLSIPTIVPTYSLTGLADLLPVLQNPASVPAPSEPVFEYPPFRIRNAYQCTFLLGTGSFGACTHLCFCPYLTFTRNSLRLEWNSSAHRCRRRDQV